MIGSAVAWLVAKGLSKGQAKGLLIVALGLLAAGAILLWFRAHDAAVIDDHEAGVQVHIERSGRAADQALQDRLNDQQAAAADAREEFDNATLGMPDEGLTRRQRLDLCGELRDAGTDTTVIPECIGLSSRGEAGAVDRGPARQ